MNDKACPCCGSPRVSASPPEADPNVLWVIADCAECGAEWRWTYKLDGVILIEDPRDPRIDALRAELDDYCREREVEVGGFVAPWTPKGRDKLIARILERLDRDAARKAGL